MQVNEVAGKFRSERRLTLHRGWSTVCRIRIPASTQATPGSYGTSSTAIIKSESLTTNSLWDVPERTPPELLLNVRRRGIHPLAMCPYFNSGPDARSYHRPRSPWRVRAV